MWGPQEADGDTGPFLPGQSEPEGKGPSGHPRVEIRNPEMGAQQQCFRVEPQGTVKTASGVSCSFFNGKGVS